MNATATLQTEPFIDEEKVLLQKIIATRRRLFVKAYIAFFFVAILSASKAFTKRISYRGEDKYFEYTLLGHYCTQKEIFFVVATLFELIVLISGIIVYLKTIHRFVKDLKLGAKELVPYEILQKEYFVVRGMESCYFRIDDPDHMHQEVDVDTFNSYSEGDVVYLYRTKYAKFYFDARGSYTVL